MKRGLEMKKTKVLVFNEENNTMITERFKQIAGEYLETDSDLYPIENTKKYFNENDSTLYYFVNIDFPEKVLAQDLKKLRRSVALQNIFNYDVRKPISITSLMPYFIILALILFG